MLHEFLMSTFQTIDDTGFCKSYNLPYILNADVLCLFTMTYLWAWAFEDVSISFSNL